jgi:hypothetical protein
LDLNAGRPERLDMKWMVMALAIVVGVCGPARAVLYLENFDSYANQTAFNTIGAWPAGIGLDTGVLSTAQSVSPTNSASFGTTPQRNDHTVGELGNPSASNSIQFSFDFYDTNASALAD